jgi:hypothetical protein
VTLYVITSAAYQFLKRYQSFIWYRAISVFVDVSQIDAKEKFKLKGQ